MNKRIFPILTALITAAAVVLCAVATYAQGVLVSEEARLPRAEIIIIHPPFPPRPFPPILPPRPRPERPVLEYKIDSIDVHVTMTDQAAEVMVSQTFTNEGSTQMEASFMFPLPYDSAIDQLTLMVDGKEFPAKIMAADKAREVYESIVRKNLDPALLEWMGYGMFKTSVFPIPPKASRTVSLKYTQLCKRTDGLTDFLFPLATAKYSTKPVGKISVHVTIDSADPIRNVYSPTQEIKIQRPTEKSASISWEVEKIVPDTDFRLLFDVGTEKLTTRTVSYMPNKDDEEGYFLLLGSPEIKAKDEKPRAKNVVFALDTSGSMMGKKITQAKDALKYVVKNLRDGDSFNILIYNTHVRLYKDSMQVASEETRNEALVFIEGIYAGGGTDINSAMTMSIEQLKKASADNPNYILFLTDGCPTVGETDDAQIALNAKKANDCKARVFSFGVGYDLNSRLMDKLVRDSSGQSEFVRENENIEDRVSRLFNKLQAPIMTNVQLTFTPADDSEAKKQGVPLVNRLYPDSGFDIFAGEQLVISGRYRFPGKGTLKVSGKINADEALEFTYPIELTEKTSNTRYAFTEKLWAMRRIGAILDDLDLNGKNKELMDELIQLSIQHGILTPYTSFLADENAQLDVASNARRVERRVDALSANTMNASGVNQRALKGAFKMAQNVAPQAQRMADADMALDSVMAEEAAAAPAVPGSYHARPSFGGSVAPAAAAPVPSAKQEKAAMAQNLRQIYNRTFFYKNNQWVDSSLTETQQNAAPRKIKQFSDEYFALARTADPELAACLTFEQPVLLNVNNQPVLIEP
ncbi:MAG: VWA domain-containing protein [Thermoguttaceae bacterium]|nr:VWA domain-containing protein [Thermoguttaceae bacterium]